jgi:hypothetical protein
MVITLPLLHAAQTVTNTLPGAIDCLVALGVAVALGAAANAVMRLRRRARRRLAGAAVSALVLLAVLPSVVPYDHLVAAAHEDAATAVHASHCHENPASCADAPVASGPGQILDAAPLLVVPAFVSVLIILASPMLCGITRRPTLRPPLACVATSI